MLFSDCQALYFGSSIGGVVVALVKKIIFSFPTDEKHNWMASLEVIIYTQLMPSNRHNQTFWSAIDVGRSNLLDGDQIQVGGCV